MTNDIDTDLIRHLADSLAMETGHTWRKHRSDKLRNLARHDHRLSNGACATCALLDEADEVIAKGDAWGEFFRVMLDEPYATRADVERLAEGAERDRERNGQEGE